ncbi:MAG: hypothetical protein AAFV53_37230 [Myxococcota bacterium]
MSWQYITITNFDAHTGAPLDETVLPVNTDEELQAATDALAERDIDEAEVWALPGEPDKENPDAFVDAVSTGQYLFKTHSARNTGPQRFKYIFINSTEQTHDNPQVLPVNTDEEMTVAMDALAEAGIGSAGVWEIPQAPTPPFDLDSEAFEEARHTAAVVYAST